MKTLIFNGSPRRHGDTQALINAFTAHLAGEVKVVSCQDPISPCVDCRYCWQNPGCSIADGMQEVYAYLAACDNVVLASPIWFSSLSGPLLNLCSRMQTFYAARQFRQEPVPPKTKGGVIILVGGAAGTEAGPTQNALSILGLMGVHRPSVATIYALDTDRVPAAADEQALARCREVALALNQGVGV